MSSVCSGLRIPIKFKPSYISRGIHGIHGSSSSSENSDVTTVTLFLLAVLLFVWWYCKCLCIRAACKQDNDDEYSAYQENGDQRDVEALQLQPVAIPLKWKD